MVLIPRLPKGYIGDPNIEHTVTGSNVLDSTDQYQNYFKIEKVKVINGVVQKDANGRVILDGLPIVNTNLFSVSGKLSTDTTPTP